MSKCGQYWSTLSCSTTPHDRLSSDLCPVRQNPAPCQSRSSACILCAFLQASCDEQRLPKNAPADVPAGAPPLLLDSAAPLAPFERLRGGCELLEKPDTPTGDMAAPVMWLCKSLMALEMVAISVTARWWHPALLPKAPACSTLSHCLVPGKAEKTPMLAFSAVGG